MTLEQIGSAAISSIISLLFSMFIFYYLRRYLDHKIDEEEKRKQEREQQQKQRVIAEAKRRHAAGRILFWLYKAVTKPPPNGELDEAMRKYTIAEEEQKTLEREILAAIESEGK